MILTRIALALTFVLSPCGEKSLRGLGRLAAIPDRGNVRGALLPNSVVAQDFVGGFESFPAGKDDALTVLAHEFELHELCREIAQGLDRVLQVADFHAIHLDQGVSVGSLVSGADLVHEHRVSQQNDSFVRKCRPVSIPAHHRIALVGIVQHRIGPVPIRKGPHIIIRRVREDHRSIDEIRGSVADQIREKPAVMGRAHRDIHLLLAAVANNGDWQLVIPREPLHQILKPQVVVVHPHHSGVVDRVIADLRQDIAGSKRIRRVMHLEPPQQHSGGFLVKLELAPQALVLEVLKRIDQHGLAVVAAVLDVLQKEVNLLHGNDVTDVISLLKLAEDQADHLPVGDRRATAVARIDGRVDLNAQSVRHLVVLGIFEPRHDSPRDREVHAPLGIAIGEHRLLNLGDIPAQRQRRMGFEERRVVEFEHGEVDRSRNRAHPGGQLLARLVGLNEDLTRRINHVRVRQDPIL